MKFAVTLFYVFAFFFVFWIFSLKPLNVECIIVGFISTLANEITLKDENR